MRPILVIALAFAALATAAPVVAQGRQQEKQQLRLIEARLARLVQVREGARLTKAEKQRLKLAAHAQYAIQALARQADVRVTAGEVDRQLQAWRIPPAAADPESARSYGEVEQARALRDVAATRLMFEKLAAESGDPRKVYAEAVRAHVADLPEEGFRLSDVLRSAPALLGALSGGGNAEGDAAGLLGQAFSAEPSRIARQLQKSAETFDGNPDRLPLLYPNTAFEDPAPQ